MIRSHSRKSYPLDKRIPKMPRRVKVKPSWTYYSLYKGYNSIQRQIIKKMHKKKQRFYDRKVSQEV